MSASSPAEPDTDGQRAADRRVPGAAEGLHGDRASAGVTADLSAKAVDTIDLVIDRVRDRIIRPILLAARALVFGLLAAVLGVVVAVVAAVAVVRLLNVYVFNGRVWAAEALIGAIFVAAGVVSWSLPARRGVERDRRD